MSTSGLPRRRNRQLAGPPVYEPAPNPASRSVDRFSDAATDVVNARVYEGIHLRFADVEARKQGRHVAQWVFSHSLRSVDDDDHDDGEDEERAIDANGFTQAAYR